MVLTPAHGHCLAYLPPSYVGRYLSTDRLISVLFYPFNSLLLLLVFHTNYAFTQFITSYRIFTLSAVFVFLLLVLAVFYIFVDTYEGLTETSGEFHFEKLYGRALMC